MLKIVIDTNVLISGVFFGGFPRRVLLAAVEGKVKACGSAEILNEYQEIIREISQRKQGNIDVGIIAPLISVMEVIEPVSQIAVCRDPEDDKFINCARDADAAYIVSGDKDLLIIKRFEDIFIITAREFCEQYLP